MWPRPAHSRPRAAGDRGAPGGSPGPPRGRPRGAPTDRLLRYETVAVPGLRTHWAVHFSPGADPGRTEVHEVLRTPFGRLGHLALTLAGKPPAAEVAANLRRLKQLLETGEVTDTAHAVAGKFERGRSGTRPGRTDPPRHTG